MVIYLYKLDNDFFLDYYDIYLVGIDLKFNMYFDFILNYGCLN